MYQFTITPNYENWTTADLMAQYAKTNGGKIERTKYGQTLLLINNVLYEYDHVKSIYENPVTVYLKEYEKPQPHYGTPRWRKQQNRI